MFSGASSIIIRSLSHFQNGDFARDNRIIVSCAEISRRSGGRQDGSPIESETSTLTMLSPDVRDLRVKIPASEKEKRSQGQRRLSHFEARKSRQSVAKALLRSEAGDLKAPQKASKSQKERHSHLVFRRRTASSFDCRLRRAAPREDRPETPPSSAAWNVSRIYLTGPCSEV